MLNIPEEIKALYRRNNSMEETVRKVNLRFYDGQIDLLYPGEDVWPSDNLFPVDDTPVLQIGPDQISYESLTRTQTLCDGTSLKFGECCASQIEIIVADVTMDVTGKEFALSVEVGGYEMMLGIYKVKSFERQADRRLRKIVAYDRMLNFDVDVAGWYNSLSFPMTLKQLRDSLCEYVGIKQRDITLPLDDMQVTKTIEPSQLSGRDAMKAICEINGCFGQIDVTGKFKYVFLGASGLFPSEELHPAEDLFPSQLEGETLSHYKEATYEDFLVYGIDQVQIRQEEGDVGAVYGGGKNAYTIQGNFLAYGKSAAELLNIAATVYACISQKIYRPCKITTAALPWVEPGDGIICYTSDDVIETYCLKRTIKGIQAMMDTFEAQGTRERKQSFGIGTQIIQLEGKTAVIKKSVEEVSVRVTDLKEYTEAQFAITADQILAEVTRAKQAEASLSIKADQIALSVTDLTNSTNSRFEQTAAQILLKVSKGEVSSQLSVESDKVTISGNRLIVNSTNFQLDGNGNATFSGDVVAAHISGSTFESDVFYANDSAVGIGDFYTSANGSNVFRSNNGWFKVNSQGPPAGSPGGDYASLYVGGDGYLGVTLNGAEGSIICGDIQARGCNLAHGSSRVWGLGETIDWFWNEFEELRDRVDNL